MKIQLINRKDINYYNSTQIILSSDQHLLKDFIGLPFSPDSILEQIKIKKNNFTFDKREILKTVLEKQYADLPLHDAVKSNISQITKDSTFTITTGQQLTLFGGPAFLFYKICHTISLCKKLCSSHPDFHFIPVFWLASEDHDKEEISEVQIFNNKYRWENDFSGATGDFPLDITFQKIKEEFITLFSNSKFDEISSHLSKFKGETLSKGYIYFLNSIFEKYGLLILDANCEELKRQMTPVFEDEIKEFKTYKNILQTNSALEQKGISPQAKIQEINLFKLSVGKRLKIKFENGFYFIENKKYNQDDLLKEMNENPSSFSPNVFLRPLFQEIILPNLGYIGGPGELNYWLQLKNNFIENNVPFPLLINRISVFYFDGPTSKKIKKLNFSNLDFVNNSIQNLQSNYLANSSELKDINWEESEERLSQAYKLTNQIYQNNTPELVKSIEAEWNTIDKTFERIKLKLHKQLKQKNEIELNQIEQIGKKILPNGIPQERYYHFFQFCTDGSLSFMHELIASIDPFSSAVMLIENE